MSMPAPRRYRHVVEIGAGDSHSSEGLSWCTHAELVTLFEPHPVLCADLRSAAQGLPNVSVRPEAVSDVGGNWPLVHLGYASYLLGYPSFYGSSIEDTAEVPQLLSPISLLVPVVTTNAAVPEDCDLLILTCGGAEHRILNTMEARPQVIQTKHYCHNARHWEEAAKLDHWLLHHGYTGAVTARNQHSTFMAVTWRRLS